MIKPVIGIGSDILSAPGERERAFVYMTYVEAVRRAGGVALLVPPQPESAADLLEVLDGLLLAGGFDCDPSVYGEDCHPTVEPMDDRRQANDLTLATLAREKGVPTLGVCLGLQVMNVAAGGGLVQDIDSQLESEIRHDSRPEERCRHSVLVAGGTQLAGILGEREMEVNSSHHQAVGRVGDGLIVTALAPDGVVEGLEDGRHPFYLGVQWHPEDMEGEPAGSAVLAAFIAAAGRYSALKKQATEMSPAVTEPSE